jgi:16S rRNA (guanine966-N2)-methyltransferase
MHIISGALKGRTFHAPLGHRTHPMGDRVKVALFNVLGELTEFSVLDAYAGSGALGLEALSHGAREVTFIDVDEKAVRTIRENISELSLDSQAKVVASTVAAWAKTATNGFDIVFADPPYDDVRTTDIQSLSKHVVHGGLLVLSAPKEFPVIEDPTLEAIKQKTFAGAQLQFYRKR